MRCLQRDRRQVCAPEPLDLRHVPVPADLHAELHRVLRETNALLRVVLQAGRRHETFPGREGPLGNEAGGQVGLVRSRPGSATMPTRSSSVMASA